MNKHHRYAAYYAPRIGSAWCRAGSRWLGRDAARGGEVIDQPVFDGLPGSQQQALTSAPRRYGWHATLTAPFTLRADIEELSLRDGLRRLCRAWKPFDMPPLEVKRLDDFLALVPTAPSAPLHAVADASVKGLHAVAEPLSESALQRRRAAGLTPAEDALLVRWGYPHVLDNFRFHISLTGSLREADAEVAAALHAAAQQHFAPLLCAPPPRFDNVSLFAEPLPGSDLCCLEQMALVR